MSEINPELTFTLDDAVVEVLGLLTGIDLQYQPELDRYRAVTRQLNRALRSNALEHEWSYYTAVMDIGDSSEGQTSQPFGNTLRPRMTGDDAVRLVDSDGVVRRWAYFLPRDALHKYGAREGLWCSVVRGTLIFSRPLWDSEAALSIQMPAMREPTMFRLPAPPTTPGDASTPVPDEVLNQPLDFSYPDVITLRAAFYVAQFDPVMQPRVQTLEAQYKDLMYQIIERDDRNTDSPYLNEFFVPIQNGITGNGMLPHGHPHSDERGRW